MLDNKTKDIMDLCDIKQELVKSMLNKYTDGKLNEEELNKFYRYLNLQLKNNNSKNNIDNRINGIYKVMQKLYNDFIKLNEIITN